MSDAVDPEMLMAYADGELDPLRAKRVERAIAADPALAAQVAAHRRLRTTLAGGFAPVADEPVPDRFTALLATPRVAPKPAALRRRWWPTAGAVAASLLVGLIVGHGIERGGIDGVRAPTASGRLSTALDRQLVATQGSGDLRMVASFRDRGGALCRVFTAPATSGIACRTGDDWALRRLAPGTHEGRGDYRQAGSASPELLAAAQDMMAGDPLDAAGEAAARDAGWR